MAIFVPSENKTENTLNIVMLLIHILINVFMFKDGLCILLTVHASSRPQFTGNTSGTKQYNQILFSYFRNEVQFYHLKLYGGVSY